MTGPTLTLQVDGDRRSFRPGETVSGRALVESGDFWDADYCDVLLFWRTEGKGTEDSAIVGERKILGDQHRATPGTEEAVFSFTLPAIPWTYHGVILKIHWMLGIYARPNGDDEVVEEIPLYVHPNPETLAERES